MRRADPALLALTLLWTLFTPVAGAEELLEKARKLEGEGQISTALSLYREWLEQPSGAQPVLPVLQHVLDLQQTAAEALSLLERYGPKIEDRAGREHLAYRRGALLEMLGRLEEAEAVYGSLPEAEEPALNAALLLFEQGFLQEARSRAAGLLARHPQGETALKGRLLLARIAAAQGHSEEAEKLFGELLGLPTGSDERPVLLLAAFEFLLQAGRRAEAEKLLETLQREYPSSAEAQLARQAWDGRATLPISYLPSPSRLLAALEGSSGGPEEGAREAASPAGGQVPIPPAAPQLAPAPQKVLVQTGSFQVRENAAYMVRDLRARGFEASIQEAAVGAALFYRVVVGPALEPARAQETLLRLKDAGFEGMLLFQED